MKIHVLLPLSVTALTLHLRCWDSLEHLHNFCTSIRKEYICFVHILNYLCLYLCLLPLIFLVWYILFSDEWGQKLYAYHVDVMSANPYLIKNKEILYQQQCAWCLFSPKKSSATLFCHVLPSSRFSIRVYFLFRVFHRCIFGPFEKVIYPEICC